MQKAVRLVRERCDEIAKTLTKEQGKPLNGAKREGVSVANAIEYFAEGAHRMMGEIIPTSSTNLRSLVIKQPVGPVAAIGPWNCPVSLLPWKMSRPLIAGCTNAADILREQKKLDIIKI